MAISRGSVALAGFSAAAVLSIAGCAGSALDPVDATTRQAILLLMPREVRIVAPFTTWADLDDTPGVDGVNVYVQPTNQTGDPIQATGSMYIELHAFRQASGDSKGDRLAIWEFPLSTREDQEARWRRALQMYEFPVLLPEDARSADPATKFVLSVTHNPPLGDRRSDEMILQVPLASEAFVGRR